MKTLVLIRHAQSENVNNDISDFDRALTKTGKHDAADIAQLLKEAGIVPQIFISSTALRALTTATIFTDTFNSKEPETTFEIYEANVPALLRVVTGMDNTNEIAAVVGHNPGVSDLLYYLSGKITTMPTCAFAVVELKTDSWNEVSGGSGELIQYSHP
jgi:phosphohistidine phosphatase